jgi:hypothetical protein
MLELPPVTPILENTSNDLLEEQEAVLWQIVRFALENPGETSELFENELISFRKLQATFGNDREGLAAAFQQAIQIVITQYYPNDSISVSVETEDRSELSYALQIAITNPQGDSLLTIDPVVVNEEGDSIDINYSRINR